jgi:hypothetical protein
MHNRKYKVEFSGKCTDSRQELSAVEAASRLPLLVIVLLDTAKADLMRTTAKVLYSIWRGLFNAEPTCAFRSNVSIALDGLGRSLPLLFPARSDSMK